MATGLQRQGVKIQVSQSWYQQRRRPLNAFSQEDAGSGEREGHVALPAPGAGRHWRGGHQQPKTLSRPAPFTAALFSWD